jgi:hypothetical protein
LCLDCALAKARDQTYAMHNRTHPDLHKSVSAGMEVARQIEAREGPLYEKWRDAMKAAAARL